jgi:hypothetical protein
MVNVTVTFDPANQAEIEQTRALLDHFTAMNNPKTTDPEAVHQKVIALLRGYGRNRTEYIRAVAQASPDRATYEDLVKIVGSPKAIGGTHSSIERAWRAKGMPGPFTCWPPRATESRLARPGRNQPPGRSGPDVLPAGVRSVGRES